MTPGPWTEEGAERLDSVYLCPDWKIVPIYARGYKIGYWIPLEWDGNCPDSKAIAALPELLEACKRALERLETIERDKGVRSCETIPDLRHIIAKAEGRQ